MNPTDPVDRWLDDGDFVPPPPWSMVYSAPIEDDRELEPIAIEEDDG